MTAAMTAWTAPHPASALGAAMPIPARPTLSSASQRLLDHLAAEPEAGHLLILFALGGASTIAELLERDPAGDPAAMIGKSLRGAVARASAEAFDLGGNLFAFVAAHDARPGAVIAEARAALAAHSEALAAGSLHGEVLMPEDAATPEQALARAVERMRARSAWLELAAGRQTRDALLRVLDERGLGGGVDRVLVTANALAVGRRFGLSLPQLEVLVRAAELQDVGKLSIPDSILSKAQALSAEEWATVRRHPLFGERILSAASALAPVARLVRSCYERWDGSGYPDTLRGDDIPIGARIIAVCVAFSAMTSPRPYRPPLTPDEALAELRAAAGVQFDPAVVEAFRAEVEPTTIRLPVAA